MGWSGGTDLFRGLIESAMKYIPDFENRKSFYKEMLSAFEDHDWDCQTECMREDTAFDQVLKEVYPDWFEDEE
jgi:hypothetical protein